MRSAAVALLLGAGCCFGGPSTPDAATTPTLAHEGSRWMPSETGGSWVWCDVQPVDATANALRCQLVDASGDCEAWSTYVHADFTPIENLPALSSVCVARAREAGGVELVEHGRIELRCGEEPVQYWFCSLGACMGPFAEGAPAPTEPAFEAPPCDVGALSSLRIVEPR